MNRIFSFLIILVFFHAGLFGQEPANASLCFIRLANATGLDGKLHFLINGEDMNVKGFGSGVATGSFGVEPGTYEVSTTHPLVEDNKYSVKLNAGDSFSIIAYTEPVIDDDGIVKKRVVKFSTLQSKAGKDKKTATLLFLSVTKEVNLEVNDASVSLVAHKQLDIAFKDAVNKQVNLKALGASLGHFDIEDPGDYAVIVFDKPDGTKGCITFYNLRW